MEKVRLGVIGYGNMGTTHSKNVYEGKVPKMELAAICDIAEARRDAAKKAYLMFPFSKQQMSFTKAVFAIS